MDMMMMMRRLTPALVLLFILLAGCEGLFTGAREISQPLTPAEDGGFAPVRLKLEPGMNPLAFNLHGSTVANVLESQRWNSYRATLTLDSAPVASASFDVNNTGGDNNAHGGPFSLTMLTASVPGPGDYELTIAPTKAREITIESARLEVRRNVRPAAK